MLAITSHAENIFGLHTVLLDGSNLTAHLLQRETFEGEVTCLGLCNIGSKAHAVASLWRDNAVYLDLYSIHDKTHVKEISMQSSKYKITTQILVEGRLKKLPLTPFTASSTFGHSQPSLPLRGKMNRLFASTGSSCLQPAVLVLWVHLGLTCAHSC
jgi:hypothetical protein